MAEHPYRTESGDISNNPRIVHIESRVDRLETDVAEIKTGVKQLLERPVLPGFAQIAGTLVSTLAAVGLILGFAEWRLTRATDPLQSALNRIETRTLHNEDSIVESRIKSAVLEERSRWLQTQSNWTAKADSLGGAGS